MSNPTCPVHKTPLLPEGAGLLFCPDCQHTVTRASVGADGKKPRKIVQFGGFQDGRRKKEI